MSFKVMLLRQSLINCVKWNEEESVKMNSVKNTRAYEFSSERAFNIFIASSTLLRHQGSGKIIFLYGTSNAGKTSICRQILAIKPSMLIDGIDAAMDRHYLKIISRIESFKRFFFDRYTTLSRCLADKYIVRFLKGGKVPFKQLSTEEECKKAKEAASYVSIIEELFFSAFHRDAAQNNLFESALHLSKNGHHIVIDAVDCNDFLAYKVSKFFHCPLLVTLVHCSFVKLAQHKEERNKMALERGQEQETRFGTYPFLQFTDFLKPRRKASEPYMHGVDKAVITKIYENHLQEELRFRPIPGANVDDIQARRTFELEILYNKLGLNVSKSGRVQLTAKCHFDMEIDTGKNTGLQGAKKVLQFI